MKPSRYEKKTLTINDFEAKEAPHSSSDFGIKAPSQQQHW